MAASHPNHQDQQLRELVSRATMVSITWIQLSWPLLIYSKKQVNNTSQPVPATPVSWLSRSLCGYRYWTAWKIRLGLQKMATIPIHRTEPNLSLPLRVQLLRTRWNRERQECYLLLPLGQERRSFPQPHHRLLPLELEMHFFLDLVCQIISTPCRFYAQWWEKKRLGQHDKGDPQSTTLRCHLHGEAILMSG